MVGKIFGKEETPKTLVRRLVVGLVLNFPGTPIPFWYSLPLIQLVDWAQELEKWQPKESTRPF